MVYSEQFKAFREACRLSREQLAARAKCHRNTVINVESGRPVKFATIIQLMGAMGFSPQSDETKLLAVLWLESVTGIQVSIADAQRLHADRAKRGSAGAQALSTEVAQRRLERDDIEVLTFAVRHRKVLNALRAIRDLIQDSVHKAVPRPR